MMFRSCKRCLKKKKKNQCLFNYVIEKVITIVNGLDCKRKGDTVKKIKKQWFSRKKIYKLNSKLNQY